MKKIRALFKRNDDKLNVIDNSITNTTIKKGKKHGIRKNFQKTKN